MIDLNVQRQCNHPHGKVTHHQIIHFNNGDKLLIQNVVYIWEKEMVHIVDLAGIEYVVNKHNVLYYEKAEAKGERDGRSTDRVKARRKRKAAKTRVQERSGSR